MMQDFKLGTTWNRYVFTLNKESKKVNVYSREYPPKKKMKEKLIGSYDFEHFGGDNNTAFNQMEKMVLNRLQKIEDGDLMKERSTLFGWIKNVPGHRIAELEGSDPRNSHKRKRTLMKRAAEIERLAEAEGLRVVVQHIP